MLAAPVSVAGCQGFDPIQSLPKGINLRMTWRKAEPTYFYHVQRDPCL